MNQLLMQQLPAIQKLQPSKQSSMAVPLPPLTVMHQDKQLRLVAQLNRLVQNL